MLTDTGFAAAFSWDRRLQTAGLTTTAAAAPRGSLPRSHDCRGRPSWHSREQLHNRSGRAPAHRLNSNQQQQELLQDSSMDWGKLLEQLQGQTKTKLQALDALQVLCMATAGSQLVFPDLGGELTQTACVCPMQSHVQATALSRDQISSLLDYTPQLLNDNNFKVGERGTHSSCFAADMPAAALCNHRPLPMCLQQRRATTAVRVGSQHTAPLLCCRWPSSC